jgi:hypothetical protein
MSNEITNPYEFFTDVDGSRLEQGYIYVGTAGLNPITNPISVFADSELTIPLAQPLRTVSGYVSNNGTPTNIFVDADDWSIAVRNVNSTTVFTNLHAGSVVDVPVTTSVATYAELLALDPALYVVGDIVRVTDQNIFGYFRVTTGSTTDDGGIKKTNGTWNLALKHFQRMFVSDISPKWFGAIGDGTTNDAVAVQKCFNYAAGASIAFDGATYKLDDEIIMLDNQVVKLNGSMLRFNVTGGKYCLKVGNGCRVGCGIINQINTTNEPGVNGSHRCPITVGGFNQGFVNQGKQNVVLENLTLDNARPDGQSLSVYSDSYNVSVTNLVITNTTGNAKNGIACHWSLNDSAGAANGTMHPSGISINGAEFSDLEVGTYLSAAYQIKIENAKYDNCGKAIEAYRGDYSNTYAPTNIQPLIGKQIYVRNCITQDCPIGIEIDGIEGLVAAQNIMEVHVDSCIFNGDTAGSSSENAIQIRGNLGGSVKNTTILNYQGYAIDFFGDGDSFEIDNCILRNNNLSAIYTRNTDNVINVTVSKSYIHSNCAGSGLSTKPAINVEALCKNWVIDNNRFGLASSETQATSVAINPGVVGITLTNNHTYDVVDYCYRVTGATSTATTSTLNMTYHGNTAAAGLVIYDGSPCSTITGDNSVKHVWYAGAMSAGTWKQGDITWNTNAASGDPIGWVCTVGGTPGTWIGFGVVL